MTQLVDDGHLDAAAAQVVARVHAFSSAIGNTDAHLGNYGLVVSESGQTTVAPFFDILPMALAPMNDELPDARLRPRPELPSDALVAPWVAELVRRVEGDGEISALFRALWLRHIGLG